MHYAFKTVRPPVMTYVLDDVAVLHPREAIAASSSIQVSYGEKNIWLKVELDGSVPMGAISLNSFQREFLGVVQGSCVEIAPKELNDSDVISKVTFVVKKLFSTRKVVTEEEVLQVFREKYSDQPILNHGHALPLVIDERSYEIRAIELFNGDDKPVGSGFLSNKAMIHISFPPKAGS